MSLFLSERKPTIRQNLNTKTDIIFKVISRKKILF